MWSAKPYRHQQQTKLVSLWLRQLCHKVPLGHNAVDRHKAVDLQYGMHGLGWPQWALCDLGIMGAVAANQEFEIDSLRQRLAL